MRALLQRVSSSRVLVDENPVGEIGPGLLILLGVRQGDSEEDAHSLAERCCVMRIFSDDEGKMNRSVQDTGGSVLVVSQFTLYADTRRGTRPSYSDAAESSVAQALYETFCDAIKQRLGDHKVSTGVFGAMMRVELTNDGPVTILVESKKPREQAP